MYGKPYMMVFFGMLQSVPLSVWVLRSFIAGIPREIDEAALLDGASLPTFFRRVLFPIAAPSIAAVAGYSFLLTWQLYLYPLIYMATSTNQLATVGVSNFVGQWSTNYPEMMAYSLLITAPLVVVFLLVQRYIVSGLTSGSVNVDRVRAELAVYWAVDIGGNPTRQRSSHTTASYLKCGLGLPMNAKNRMNGPRRRSPLG